MTPTRKLWVVLALTLAVVAGLASYVAVKRRAGLPSPGSEAYEQTTRRFFRGLAALQVGLVDAAKQEFTQATALAPGEPASWANLGLAHLRLGEFDAAGSGARTRSGPCTLVERGQVPDWPTRNVTRTA